MEFPSRVFLCVADVFKALEVPGISEGEVISAGYDDLMRRAEKISDATWRQSFLENAVENKAIVKRWEKLCKAASLSELESVSVYSR